MSAAAPFAAIETRVNRRVIDRLSNVAAVIGGTQVYGVFEMPFELGSVGLAGMATSQPELLVAATDLPAAVRQDPAGEPIEVAGRNYRVAESRPDGTGITRLLLEASA